jgi:epoxyqueuosine reductase QueG
MDEEKANMMRLRSFFDGELARISYDGIIGAASFTAVYDELMPQQKDRLMELSGMGPSEQRRAKSIICIGIAYPEHAIRSINVMVDGVVDKARWNIYAGEYGAINRHLNAIAQEIADAFDGVPIAATIGGLIGKVGNVGEYYPLTVSHRVVAENAGLGWRGKNELIVNETYGCAVRFASIITTLALPHGRKPMFGCGTCAACLEACAFLKNKERLSDYRESCRRFINSLELADDVCGKCIAACDRQGTFRSRPRRT